MFTYELTYDITCVQFCKHSKTKYDVTNTQGQKFTHISITGYFTISVTNCDKDEE